MNTRAQSTPQPIELSLPQRRRADLFRWWSPKAGRMLSAASYLEFRHLLWREIDSTVLALCERPLQIDAYVEGEHLKYMFDAWIRFRNGEERFIEVKPEAALIDGAPRRWLEVLFMNADRDEHSYKISLRAARLLRSDIQERKRTFLQVRRLYDMRSAMVHTGNVKNEYGLDDVKISAHDIVEDVDVLCTEAIRAFLRLGGIPSDWRPIELA
jgi:hypothetical protein